MPRTAVSSALATMEALVPEDDWSAWSAMREKLARRHNTVRRFLSLLDESDALGAAPAWRRILKAVRRLPALSPEGQDRPLLPREVDAEMVPAMWKRAVFSNTKLPQGAVDRNAYVVCVPEQLHRALNRRDVFASPSNRWAVLAEDHHGGQAPQDRPARPAVRGPLLDRVPRRLRPRLRPAHPHGGPARLPGRPTGLAELQHRTDPGHRPGEQGTHPLPLVPTSTGTTYAPTPLARRTPRSSPPSPASSRPDVGRRAARLRRRPALRRLRQEHQHWPLAQVLRLQTPRDLAQRRQRPGRRGRKWSRPTTPRSPTWPSGCTRCSASASCRASATWTTSGSGGPTHPRRAAPRTGTGRWRPSPATR